MVPLRGLQLLCCAVVAGIGIHFSLGTPTPRDNTSIAVTAFELASGPNRAWMPRWMPPPQACRRSA